MFGPLRSIQKTDGVDESVLVSRHSSLSILSSLMCFLLRCLVTKPSSPPSSQELSEFSEGPETMWTVADDNLNQVRWTTDLIIL